MNIYFIGSNPSEKSSRSVPFWYDAKSTQKLNEWLHELDLPHSTFHMFNVCDFTTPNNRPLKISEIKTALPSLLKKIEQCALPEGTSYKIIALGKTAQKALTLLGIDHYGMPHPSGLNRQLNDKKFIEEKINGLRAYLNPFKT